ncbi:hypothetical protein CHS0354_010292 [Potamilus streckersoni]|uniref:Fibrinogen C-terminal domain-containing protein n=1 Tax=Potamilus streckersoni TaxID=2493646 RepID=A0AAE0WBH7_9BIVA|nr:hypothetical protein CHS0354_010292 [Potamilus streckersoni]
MSLLQICFIFYVYYHLVFGDDDLFVCRRVTDTCERRDRRIDELEEKIRQLQLLLQSPSQTEENVMTTTYQRHPRDCKEIFYGGNTKDGIYKISPDGRCPFEVFCDMTNGGWTVIQKRLDGSVNFNRGWDDYVSGFGKIDGEHWLGLEKIHRLTHGGSQIHFTLELYTRKIEHAHYKAFTIDDVTTAYEMKVDPYEYEGSLPELFSHHNNMRFATFDRDVNGCASKLGGGGWWYNHCYKLANVNGVYGTQGDIGIAYWDQSRHDIKNTTVKLQRREYFCN